MDALTYFKEKARMTKDCSIRCNDCTLYVNFNTNGNNFIGCSSEESKYPEKAIGIVQKWAKENPVRTYKSVFFEKFPNAPRCSKGYPRCFIENIFGGKSEYPSHFEMWDEEYQEPRP